MSTLTVPKSQDLHAIDHLILVAERKMRVLRRTEIELATMRKVRRQLVESAGQRDAMRATSDRPIGARDAVLEFLRRNQGTHTSPQIAELLHPVIHSKSEDRRRVVLSTVSNLARDGVIERDTLGRMRLAEPQEKEVEYG